MTDLGKMRHFLGVKVIQNDAGIFICQRWYAHEVLARLSMMDNNFVRNPIVPETIMSKDDEGAPINASKFK